MGHQTRGKSPPEFWRYGILAFWHSRNGSWDQPRPWIVFVFCTNVKSERRMTFQKLKLIKRAWLWSLHVGNLSCWLRFLELPGECVIIWYRISPNWILSGLICWECWRCWCVLGGVFRVIECMGGFLLRVWSGGQLVTSGWVSGPAVN